MGSSIASPAALSAAEAIEALTEARERTLAIVDSVSDADLQRVHSTLMSPLVWDLGHIAAFEDLWLVHRYGGRPLLRDDLADVYDAFETPRAGRGDLPFLAPAAARRYLEEVRARTIEVIEEHGVGDGLVHELVIQHEHQHNETMFQTIQLARLADYHLSGRHPAPSPPASAFTGLELIEIPGGRCTIGAPDYGFAYDNERPRHHTDVRGYMIGQTPITNATYLTFVEGGGYERREWWSHEGWAWKEEYDITRPGCWTAELDAEWRLGRLVALHPHQPVVHVSWFEADAFARAHNARLPTEIEWEKAATWDQERREALRYPWGKSRRSPASTPMSTISARAPPSRVAIAPAPRRRDVWGWSATRGSGPRATSTATRGSPRTPTGSTRRCSSAPSTGSCAAARGRRARV